MEAQRAEMAAERSLSSSTSFALSSIPTEHRAPRSKLPRTCANRREASARLEQEDERGASIPASGCH
eukprot:939116-Rhodomonas_salina.1